MKVIQLQRDATCKGCGKLIPAGSSARYYSADAIYCQTHQKDEQGNDAFYAALKQRPIAPLPALAPAIDPGGLAITHQDILDLGQQLGDMEKALQWATDNVALATDFLNTLSILLRQNQEARNAQTVNSPSKPAKASVQKKA